MVFENFDKRETQRGIDEQDQGVEQKLSNEEIESFGKKRQEEQEEIREQEQSYTRNKNPEYQEQIQQGASDAYGVPRSDPDIQNLTLDNGESSGDIELSDFDNINNGENIELSEKDPSRVNFDRQDILENLDSSKRDEINSKISEIAGEFMQNTKDPIDNIGDLFKILGDTVNKLLTELGINFDTSGNRGDPNAVSNFSYGGGFGKFDFGDLPPGAGINGKDFILDNEKLLEQFGLDLSSIGVDQYRHSGTSPLCARTTRLTFEKNGINVPNGHARDLFAQFKSSSGEIRGADVGPYLLNQVSSGNNFFDLTMCNYANNRDPKGTSGYHRVPAILGNDGVLYVSDPYYGPQPAPDGWNNKSANRYPLANHPHIQKPNAIFAVGPSHSKK
ncbi:hypothetical protein [Candidatus Vampirococcus lugosii]|uniref:Peptidase C39-like domain-containing protein n=1 Tax=Candidatus Vampirococcus lugosii TaxID=2789015 RepID=A0ABS5QL25_9BACT|nr:hypothetical protein [Candidatus Vampirococcus lugosii]MBS8121767.1 hypothetical protein [Candidatus Vampirococcus lugosii]